MGRSLIEDLYKEKYNHFVKVFKKKYPRLNNVEDIVQDTFLKLLERDVKNTNVSSLAYIAINNNFKNYFRVLKNQTEHVEVTDYLDLEEKKSDPQIEKVVKEYNELYLHYYMGFNYYEVAEILGIPMNTVKTRIRLSKIKLKRRLDNYVNK